MSRSEVNSEIQVVSRPGQAFPFSSPSTPPHPHISQWCRFTVPERLPLQPFRQDRLNRLPLPPSVAMATTLSGAGSYPSLQQLDKQRTGGVDPLQKIQQLEKSLVFVRENHAFMLKGLHVEIAELKQKNRELLFELVTGVKALPKDLTEDRVDRDSPEDQQDKIEKLEKEIRKLRGALKDAMKANSSLSNQLQEIKREQYSKYSSRNQVYTKTPPNSVIDDEHLAHSPCGPSPQMEEYTDTLRQIQRAALHRSGKRDERRHHHEESKSEWSDNYSRNGGNGYHRHHHHQPQKSPQQHQQQPRLPRLPLRNQQNYSHPQYEIQYRQRSTNSLPALKPLVPVVEHRFDKPRKPRGPRPPKIADQVING